jgi:hypothetical protein
MRQPIDFEGIKAAALRNGRSLLPNFRTGVWKDFATGRAGHDWHTNQRKWLRDICKELERKVAV